MYTRDGVNSLDKQYARKIKQYARYCIIDEVLYKRSISGPYLRCLGSEEAKRVMTKIHKGECENHSGSRALAIIVKRQGYFWPMILSDAELCVMKCDKCQRHENTLRQPGEELSSISSPYPFLKLLMDIVGPMPRASRG